MAFEIIWTDNALDDLREILDYLESELSKSVSEDFLLKCISKIDVISNFPFAGPQSEKVENVRKILITKQNMLFYQVEDALIVLLDFFDTRQDPEKSEY